MKNLNSPVFDGLTLSEIEEIDAMKLVRTKTYRKGDVIFSTGDIIHEVCVILSGSVNIENIDFNGNRSILDNVDAGKVFAESYALCGEPMLVDAVAARDCDILFLDLRALMDSRNSEKSWYCKVMHNMLDISVRKNLVLSKRVLCTSPKTIRGRLLNYLTAQSLAAGSSTFRIPFDRQQLADYLNTDRSALSKELGKMRDEGILDFEKDHFTLHGEL